MASALALQQGGAPLGDSSIQSAQNLVTQYAPQTGATPGLGGPIAPDPYIDQLNERNEEQARFEQEHGRFATIATQGARGVLDFVLAAPALLSAGAEGAGALTGWRGLQDFGRDLGESSTGTAAMATLFGSAGLEATKSLFGAQNDPEKANTAYEQTRRDIEQQQEAWPMLSTISHFAGVVAPSIGLGALAGGAEAGASAGAATVAPVAPTFAHVAARAAGMGAIEGSEAGAQSAYDAHRPLRDVIGSTIMGGLLGAGTAVGFQGAAHYFEGEGFTEGLENFSRDRTFKAIGGIASDARKVGGVDEARRLAKDVAEYTMADGEKVIPEGIIKAGTMPLDEITERIGAAHEEVASKLGTIRNSVGEFIDKEAPALKPNVDVLESRIRKDVLNELESSAISGNKAGPILDVIKDLRGAANEDGSLSLSALRTVQDRLKRVVYPKNPGGGLSALVSPAREEQMITERIIEDEMTRAVDRGAAQMAKAGEDGAELAGRYTEVKKLTQSFLQADQIAHTAAIRRLGNRGASLTDTLVGGAALAGDLASGGGIGAAAKALGMTALHKFAREHGSAFMAALANKLAGHAEEVGEGLAKASDWLGEANIGAEGEADLADAAQAEAAERTGVAAGTAGGNMLTWLWPRADHRVVSVDAAGGREAQSVIATLERSRQYVNAAVESAGPNPVQRQAAQRAAQSTVAEELARRAGPFDPTTWAQKPPNPLQKVLHRPEILDQVSTDLARDAAHAASLKPSPDFDLNFDRVKRMTRDADGPQAIGGVQQAVRELGRDAPPTPTGDQLRLVSRMALQHLSDVSVPDAMTAGHQLARQLSGMADGAADQVTKDYVARQVTTLQQALSDPSFGQAGKLYGQLTAPPSPDFQQLLDPATLRASLAAAESRGALPSALHDLTNAVLAAHDARRQFGGGPPDREVTQALKATEDRFAKAEGAVTLDGGPAGRVLDFFQNAPGADARGLKGSPQMLVLNAIRPQMEKMLPVLGKASDRYSGAREKPTVPDLPRSTGELQELYTQRMQTLATAATGQDTDSAAAAMRGMPNVPPATQTAVLSDAQARMSQLLQDIPKPARNMRGKAFESLSSSDLRKANAMWEATVKPMSVFADFHAGTLDYDKAQYTWKQYPGLQQAAQAGMLDIMHVHLDDDQRAAIPDPMLTQIDYLLGFNGTLQTSVDRGFAARVTAMGAAEAQKKPQSNGPLELETSKPTFTERLSGARKG